MKTQSNLHASSRLLLGAFALAAAAAYAYQVHAETSQPPIPRGAAMNTWQENGRDGRYLLQVIEGNLPKARKPITGIVTSDTDCDPDAEGLSHCHNIIELPGGGKLTVIDSHNMHRNRCLGEGDRLSLTRLGGSWIMGTLPAK